MTLWIRSGEYKLLSEAPLTGEAATAFEAELDSSRFCKIPDQEFNEKVVATDSKKDAVCMWSRVWNEANAGNVNVRVLLPSPRPETSSCGLLACLHCLKDVNVAIFQDIW